MPDLTQFLLQIVIIGAIALMIPACSKPARVETADDSRTPPKSQPGHDVSTPADGTASAPGNFQPAPGATASGEAPVEKSAAALEQKYLATTDSDTREDIVEQLRDLDNPEAVQVFGRMFQAATDEDDKLDVLATLDQMDTDAGKLAILASAVRPDQTQDVRTSAIDSLADLDEPGALQMLNGLTNDPDPQIRQAAKDALQSIADAEKETPR